MFYDRLTNISVLLAHGAEIDWKAAGDSTPLHAAVLQHAYTTALFLYRAGANPSIKTTYGYSPADTLKQFGERSSFRRGERAAYKELVSEWKKAGWLDGK